jgi:chromosome segregation ATPase
MNSISSLPIPRCSSDSDSDGEESALGLVMDRSAASSTVSLEPEERVDALKRTNAELVRKLIESERTLQHTMSQHELELEENQSRIEELKSELSATKREEKELRSKEVRFPNIDDPSSALIIPSAAKFNPNCCARI